MLAALVLPAWTGASVVMDPVARLALEGGYDSNVAYDGNGGGRMARLSPDVGLALRDHLWTVRGTYGADLLHYPARQAQARETVVNQRARLALDWRPGPRTTLDLELSGSYAPDPIGLARFGYVIDAGDAVLWAGDARLARRVDRRLTLAATFRERAARIDGEGVALHAPGLEAGWRLDERTSAGARYRYDAFQRIGGDLETGSAHEALGFAEWRWTRRVRLEAEAGAAVWRGPEGGADVIPVGSAAVVASGRPGDVRLQARHGIGINALARASLSDAIEVGWAWRLTRRIVFRGDGGFWSGGALPYGRDATTGYGLSGELAWLFRTGLEVGVGGSRYARLDDTSSRFERNQVGLRMAWQLATH